MRKASFCTSYGIPLAAQVEIGAGTITVNHIRKIIQARIDNIIQLSDVAGNVPHRPTVGALREEYLTEFFRELVPDSVSITSGFIADATGNISPQLDLIVIQKSSLPLISMKNGLSIVPVESAILVAEMKSTLTTTDLKQVEIQNDSISKLQVTVEIDNSRFIIPTVVLAYDTNIAKETITSWMEKNGNTVAFCILKKDSYVKDVGILVFENEQHGIRHHGVLAFIATFHKALNYLVGQRNFEPNLDAYLTGRPPTKRHT